MLRENSAAYPASGHRRLSPQIFDSLRRVEIVEHARPPRAAVERVSVKSMKAGSDAGLRVLKIIAVRRWPSDKWVVLAEVGMSIRRVSR
jgi:hypothetical protein